MKTKLPNTRRKFAHIWDEIGYLKDKLLHWFYDRELPGRARLYAKRLQKLVEQADADQESILGQECRALISERNGDLQAAIRFREQEIRKIKRLHQISGRSSERIDACRGYDYDALSDRLDLLAILYDQIGDTRRAVGLLEESKELCRKHGLAFDGQKVFDELSHDLEPSATANGRSRQNPKSA